MRMRVVPFLLSLLFLAGCVVTGKDFPTPAVKKIVNGQTTQTEIQTTFGEPYMKVNQGGKETWTYYRELQGVPNRYQTKQLRVFFDERKVVESYEFTINYPEE